MEAKNPLIRFIIFARLKHMMNEFRGIKLKTVEQNLVRGIFKRKNKDFQEKMRQIASQFSLLTRLTGGVF